MPEGMRKVMVVEDSDDYAFLLSRALNHSRRFQIVWRAKDGQEAVAYLAGTGKFSDRQRFPCPEVVLLDIRLPAKEDGFEVLASVVQQENRPRIVMMTVLENAGDHQKALSAGADEFKLKPYEEQELAHFVRWLDEWIGNPPASADAPRSQTRSPKPVSPGRPQHRGSSRGECAADRNRRLRK
jgi:CheY-like chemotaxis protein